MKSPDRQTKHRAYISEIGDLKSTLQAGLDFVNWDKYVGQNSKVFVKPNFTFPHYKEGVTTSPDFLRCLIQLLKTRAGTVIVGESDGGNRSFTAEAAFQGHDMYRICQETGAELVSLSKLPAETIEATILGKKLKVQLPELLLREIDCFISVPVLKTHVITTVTLSLKNSWGCLPDAMRCLQHRDLVYKLALLARLLKPKIVVIDATYALDRHGPMYGEVVKTNLALVADNSVAADALGARVMGFAPERIKSIAVAEKAGLGSTRLEDIEVNQDWQRYKRQFTVEKTIIDRASTLLFYSNTLARLVMASPLTPLIYGIAGRFKSASEREVANQLGKPKKLGHYW